MKSRQKEWLLVLHRQLKELFHKIVVFAFYFLLYCVEEIGIDVKMVYSIFMLALAQRLTAN